MPQVSSLTRQYQGNPLRKFFGDFTSHLPPIEASISPVRRGGEILGNRGTAVGRRL